MEELEEKELNLIRKALQTQIKVNDNDILALGKADFESMKGLFADKESFEQYNKNTVDTLKAENEEIENLIEKTYNF